VVEVVREPVGGGPRVAAAATVVVVLKVKIGTSPVVEGGREMV